MLTQELAVDELESLENLEIIDTVFLENIIFYTPKKYRVHKEAGNNVYKKRLSSKTDQQSVIIDFILSEKLDLHEIKNLCSLTFYIYRGLVKVYVEKQDAAIKDIPIRSLTSADQLPLEKNRKPNIKYITLLEGKFYFKAKPVSEIFNNHN